MRFWLQVTPADCFSWHATRPYLSLWHPGGISLMRPVETMLLRKTGRGEGDPRHGRAPLSLPAFDPFSTPPRGQPCRGAGRLASLVYFTNVFVLQPGFPSLPLSLRGKYRTWVQTCSQEYKFKAYLLLPSGRPSGGGPAEEGRSIAQARGAWKESSEDLSLNCIYSGLDIL